MEEISIQVETTKDNDLKIVILKGPKKEEAPLEYAEGIPMFCKDYDGDFYLLGYKKGGGIFSIYISKGDILNRSLYEDVIRNLRECCRSLRLVMKRLGER
jgi:hypothetical protein